MFRFHSFPLFDQIYSFPIHQIDVEEGSGRSKTQLLLDEEQNIEELQERERAIQQLESDIVDVNTIFKDLATLVHEQVFKEFELFLILFTNR